MWRAANVRRRTDEVCRNLLQEAMGREAVVGLVEKNLFLCRAEFSKHRFLSARICRNMLFAALLLSPATVFSDDEAAKPSEDVSATKNVNRWLCDRGFRKIGKACVEIKLPDNAYLTNNAYGRGWECRRGYIERYDACIAIRIPENAFLVSQRGDVWKCDRGYSPVGASCIAIRVPKHAYLTSSNYGTGWACDRGYRASSGDCFALEVPKNAHIDYSGHGWQCDRPYRKRAGICSLP